MSTVDDELARFYNKMPHGMQALHYDGQFAAEVEQLRRILSMVDLAMEYEEIHPETRRRVIRNVLFDGPDEVVDAIERIHDHARAPCRKSAARRCP